MDDTNDDKADTVTDIELNELIDMAIELHLEGRTWTDISELIAYGGFGHVVERVIEAAKLAT